ncbi:hypothetical protein AU468_03890 [Alkalispirochaeta sphaeroplastigenens]|uniref:Hydroxymethylglutaryl-CoA synthase n=1 Tax=Alkalispirochaeta sphaeroplastigenens TaxID=1187066 RepID=A0A2S4JXB0_9SPIO|nr:hydroxymethylglutaryl-CoA synthase [Alkalispirochaeta sphaeroplastigenens]POR04123.1 hypothetical protein AU468_03890 [Alkalispirochaeta sphaeroplastigenens]
MTGKPVGISDMALFVPTPKIDLSTLLTTRAAADPRFERRLRLAIESTNQVSMRFPAPWEDPVTLAAQAADELLRRGNTEQDRARSLRFLVTGTETSVDMSKPISAYVQGALQRNGLDLPQTLSTFQVQHACAGGTLALMSVASLLGTTGRPGDRGLVMCTDIARYETPSTAEITQGAGAVAMLVEENPRLLELNLASTGFSSSDVDDFFRPLGSVTARVKGRYSVDCYNEALETAFLDHCARAGTDPARTLKETDLFVVHVPFHKMALMGMSRLVERHLGTSPAETKEFLQERHFQSGIEAIRHIGNTYSASAFVSLMFTLAERHREEGDALVGRKILLASYGSGNTMSVFSLTVAPEAPQVLATWDMERVLQEARPASFAEYQSFVGEVPPEEQAQAAPIPPGRYYLKEIRDDQYRIYECTAP